MRRWRWRWLGGMALVALAVPVRAGFPVPREVVCPVGGERFTHYDTGSYSIFGHRPDGKPYGSWIFPMPLPVCPKNGLPIWKEFSADEVSNLRRHVASAEWKARVAGETPYWRAHWLARQMQPDGEDWRWLLLQAGWEADEDLARRARYLGELVAAAADLPAAGDWLVYSMRAANALRELGDFTAAMRALDALDREVAGLPAQTDEARGERDGLARFLQRLRSAVERQDRSIELLELTGGLALMHRCTDRAMGEALADPTGACDSPKVKEWVAMQKAEEKERVEQSP